MKVCHQDHLRSRSRDVFVCVMLCLMVIVEDHIVYVVLGCLIQDLMMYFEILC